jgi:hypothetical protein
MTFEFINARDFDDTPAQYVRYLRDSYANAERILSLPEQKWPRGSSHDISRAIMAECQEAHDDIALEFGLYSAEGKLIDYAAS